MAMIPWYNPRDNTIAELLMRQGDIQARSQQQRGMLWANAINQVGQIGAQAYERHQEEKQREKASAALESAFSTWDGEDPRALYRSLAPALGPEAAIKVTTGFASLTKSATPDPKVVVGGLAALPEDFLAKNWKQVKPRLDSVFGITLPDEATPEVFQAIRTYDAKLNGGAKPEGALVDTVGPGGVPVRRRASEEELAKGVPIYKEAEKPKQYQVTVPGPNGQPITRLATEEEMAKGVPTYRAPNTSMIIQGDKEADEKINAADIVEGRADLSLYSKRDNRSLMAEASRYSMEKYGRPFNFNKAMLDFTAAKRHVQAMNSNQRYTFRGLADTVVNTMDEVKLLAEELKQGNAQLFNKAKRNTILQLYSNTPQAETAARYVSAVNTLKEEFANLAQGGFAPTEAAWKLAEEQINTDYGLKAFTASVNEAQRLINYRVKAFEDLGPAYVGGAPGQEGGGGFSLPGGAAPAAGAGQKRPPNVPANYRFDAVRGLWVAP